MVSSLLRPDACQDDVLDWLDVIVLLYWLFLLFCIVLSLLSPVLIVAAFFSVTSLFGMLQSSGPAAWIGCGDSTLELFFHKGSSLSESRYTGCHSTVAKQTGKSACTASQPASQWISSVMLCLTVHMMAVRSVAYPRSNIWMVHTLPDCRGA